jgi:Tol biopolymer transport system component
MLMALILLLLAQNDILVPPAWFCRPRTTPYGIIATDGYGSSLYLIRGDSVEILIASPGCGRNFTVSPDRTKIGYKAIDENGRQAPALLDLTTRRRTLLSQPVPQCGQVSFTADGGVAYTIGRELIIERGPVRDKIPLDRYANIAPISPAADAVVFNDDNDQLWLRDFLKGSCVQITDGQTGYFAPFWSGDGENILYSSLNGSMKVFDRIADITHDLGFGFVPSWSADNNLILYYIPESDGRRLISSDLYLIRPDGTGKTSLTASSEALETDPTFLGDDGSLIFLDRKTGSLMAGRIKEAGLRDVRMVIPAPPEPPVNRSLIGAGPAILDSLDIPYINQVYDSPDWFNGHWACGPTTALMAIVYYRKLPVWNCWASSPWGHESPYGRYLCERYHYRETDYNQEAQDPSGTWAKGGYGYMWYDGYSPHSRMADYITRHDLTSWTDDTPTFSEATAEVNAGFPYGMCVGLTTAGHLILAIGQVQDWHTLIFNDPYGNKNLPGYPNYYGKYSRYDWPGYNNGYQNLNNVYWCAGSEGDWEPARDTIVDDLQFGDGFYLHTESPSSMAYWWDRLTGYRGHLWYTITTAGVTDTCYATWTPDLPVSGEYEVYAYIPGQDAAAQARYQIRHAAGCDTVVINQADYSDEWVSLGAYQFVNGNYVYLGDATGTQGQHIGFDALKWSYRGTAVAERESRKGLVRFQVVSNPVRDRLLIDFAPSDAGPVAIDVFDPQGRLLISDISRLNRNRGTFTAVDCHRLPAGVYFVRIGNGAGTGARKFIKLR